MSFKEGETASVKRRGLVRVRTCRLYHPARHLYPAVAGELQNIGSLVEAATNDPPYRSGCKTVDRLHQPGQVSELHCNALLAKRPHDRRDHTPTPDRHFFSPKIFPCPGDSDVDSLSDRKR